MTQAEFDFIRECLGAGANKLISEIAQNNNIVTQLRSAKPEPRSESKTQKTEKTTKKGESK